MISIIYIVHIQFGEHVQIMQIVHRSHPRVIVCVLYMHTTVDHTDPTRTSVCVISIYTTVDHIRPTRVGVCTTYVRRAI